ncbi:MAG: hypothetical protein EXS02_10135 [Planctomycetes bacterium]|nr:hypothetical protein [Planctomycetota bacterium]
MLRARHAVLVPVGIILVMALPSWFGFGRHGDSPSDAISPDAMVAYRNADGTSFTPVADPRRLPGSMLLSFESNWAGKEVDFCCHRIDLPHSGNAGDVQLRLPIPMQGPARIAGLGNGRFSLHAVTVVDGEVWIANGELLAEAAQGPVTVAMHDSIGAAPR